ncbi:MAG: AAA family ATPase [Candidatus Margulisbacteria bacterium]|nr:AAA family ATPase [Candidatus Margulisiibacteriota bacterium]
MSKSDDFSKDLFDFLGQNANQTGETHPDPPQKDPILDLSFSLKPKEIKAHLDRFVIQQNEAKKVISVAICDHYNHIQHCLKNNNPMHYAKQNVVMIGPTGVGKTYLIKCVSELIGVPFIKSDATKFTETGYIGGDVEDLVRQLVTKADGNVDLAQCGIIYLDEIDKIASPSKMDHKDVGGRGVQTNLLKLMEDTEVPLKTAWDIQSQLKGMFGSNQHSKETICTKNILFIVSGAFNGLDEIVKKRVSGSQYGFKPNHQESNPNEMSKVTTEDLISYGLEPEFVGRLPVRVPCQELNTLDLYQILKDSEESLLHQTVSAFKSYGIDISFTDQSLLDAAKLAHKEKTGARGLSTVFETHFRDLKFELPSTKVKRFLVTDHLFKDPKAFLNVIVTNPSQTEKEYLTYQFDQFEKTYLETNQLRIKFDEDVRDYITSYADTLQKSILEACHKTLLSLQYATNMMKSKLPDQEFLITSSVIEQSERYLEEWVKETTHSSSQK